MYDTMSGVEEEVGISKEESINYFGYGPIINPIVRRRRGVLTFHDLAAILPDYRLMFTCGGGVNVVPQRGYQVQGVLLRFPTAADWAKFQAFDAGYDVAKVKVYPFDTSEEPVTAYMFLMKGHDYSSSNTKDDLKYRPQERYLNLMASGMREYSFDEDYIDDNIMSVPYVPKTKPEAYKTFPQTHSVLPKITMERYQDRLCRQKRCSDIYFVVGSKIIRVVSQEVSNPCSIWLRARVHGLGDSTLTLHQTVVDLDLPMVNTQEEITPQHVAWAENHYVEWLDQSDMSGMAVFRLVSESGSSQRSSLPSRLWRYFCRKCAMLTTIGQPVSASPQI